MFFTLTAESEWQTTQQGIKIWESCELMRTGAAVCCFQSNTHEQKQRHAGIPGWMQYKATVSKSVFCFGFFG